MRLLSVVLLLVLAAPAAAPAAERSGGLSVPPSGGLAAPVPDPEPARPARPPFAEPPAAAYPASRSETTLRAHEAATPAAAPQTAQADDLSVQVPVPEEEDPVLPEGPAAEEATSVGLAQTGFELAPLLGAGLALMGAGLVLLYVARRRPSA